MKIVITYVNHKHINESYSLLKKRNKSRGEPLTWIYIYLQERRCIVMGKHMRSDGLMGLHRSNVSSDVNIALDKFFFCCMWIAYLNLCLGESLAVCRWYTSFDAVHGQRVIKYKPRNYSMKWFSGVMTINWY